MSDLMETDESDLMRSNSIYLRGVDNLSQKDVKNYLKRYVDDHFKIEWINDSAVNIVFEEEEEASKALRALALDTEVEVDRLTEREAAKFDKSKPDVEFTIRFSKIGDRKVKNAAQFSRYYLMNPEEEQKYKSAKYVSRSLREREPLGRKSRVLSDDEDDIDLFPSKAEDIVIPEEKPEEDDRTTRSSSLADRVTLSKPSRSLADRLSMLDDDDLFK